MTGKEIINKDVDTFKKKFRSKAKALKAKKVVKGALKKFHDYPEYEDKNNYEPND